MERGYPEEDVLYKWENHVVPAYKEFLLPYRDRCNKIIVNNNDTPDDIIRITEEISLRVKREVLQIMIPWSIVNRSFGA
jgi:uridine kinase